MSVSNTTTIHRRVVLEAVPMYCFSMPSTVVLSVCILLVANHSANPTTIICTLS
jgi:hypothetical protein